MACNLGPDLSIRGECIVVTDPVFSNNEAELPSYTRSEDYIEGLQLQPTANRHKLHQPRTP